MSSQSTVASHQDEYESSSMKNSTANEQNVKVSDLFDTSKPWVLVSNGSIMGFFDYVPERLRVGPWSPVAPAMLFVMVYLVICGIAVAAYEQSTASAPKIESTGDYPQVGSGLWYYNALCCIWMTIISISVVRGPAGYKPWVAYTMWSWTILQMRHGLAALAPLLLQYPFLFHLLELSRFPVLVMHSITFVVWNFVLMPVVYFFFMDDAVKRKNFLGYFLQFRLIQLHVFNILFAYLNCVVASPPRRLVFQDFMAALSIGIVYILFYLLVLDRIGVHLYPIFSPRSAWVVGTWFFLISCYVGCFHGWNSILVATAE